MIQNYLEPFLTGTLAVTIFMALLWLLHIPLRNAAIVDVGWSLSIPLLALIYYLYLPEKREYHHWLFSMVVLWGLRLGLYLFLTRIYKAKEEGRYVALRESWKENLLFKFFLFYEAQALLALWLSLPFLLAFGHPQAEVTLLQILAIILFFISFFGETIADLQLYFFKKKKENEGKICQQGLWRYSRHPNYFFEILVWWSYALYSLQAPYGFVGILAPITIMYFILGITGIPATEEQNLRSKGEAYRHYQKTTNRLIPWFPKKAL